jgi:hypothetical protein
MFPAMFRNIRERVELEMAMSRNKDICRFPKSVEKRMFKEIPGKTGINIFNCKSLDDFIAFRYMINTIIPDKMKTVDGNGKDFTERGIFRQVYSNISHRYYDLYWTLRTREIGTCPGFNFDTDVFMGGEMAMMLYGAMIPQNDMTGYICICIRDSTRHLQEMDEFITSRLDLVRSEDSYNYVKGYSETHVYRHYKYDDSEDVSLLLCLVRTDMMSNRLGISIKLFNMICVLNHFKMDYLRYVIYSDKDTQTREIKLLTLSQRATCIRDLIHTRELLYGDIEDDTECKKCKLHYSDEEANISMAGVLSNVSLRISHDIPQEKRQVDTLAQLASAAALSQDM